jgi:hypothetical protein
MARTTLFFVSIFSLVALGACKRGGEQAQVKPPPAPTMPAHWEVISDVAIAPGAIKPISSKLGGEIIALRNTRYKVSGKTIQLNTILPADTDAADAVMVALKKMKSEIAMVRTDRIIYEFVCGNEALPELDAARALLTGRGGP